MYRYVPNTDIELLNRRVASCQIVTSHITLETRVAGGQVGSKILFARVHRFEIIVRNFERARVLSGADRIQVAGHVDATGTPENLRDAASLLDPSIACLVNNDHLVATAGRVKRVELAVFFYRGDLHCREEKKEMM